MRSSLRVLTPPVSALLTTVDAVQDELGNYDPLSAIRIRRLIRQASGLIVAYTGCEFAKARYQETFDMPVSWRSDCVPPLRLSALPITAVVGVVSAGMERDVAHVMVGKLGQVMNIWGAGPTVITYDAGYIVPEQATATVASDLPADIERACIDTVVALWHRAGRGDPMIRSESVEGIGSTSYLDPASGSQAALPPTAVAALASYRSINV